MAFLIFVASTAKCRSSGQCRDGRRRASRSRRRVRVLCGKGVRIGALLAHFSYSAMGAAAKRGRCRGTTVATPFSKSSGRGGLVRPLDEVVEGGPHVTLYFAREAADRASYVRGPGA